jgi:hypothetical protein
MGWEGVVVQWMGMQLIGPHGMVDETCIEMEREGDGEGATEPHTHA